jgi:hypothetical protein
MKKTECRKSRDTVPLSTALFLLDDPFGKCVSRLFMKNTFLCAASYPDHTRDSILATFGTSFLPVTLIYGTSLPVRYHQAWKSPNLQTIKMKLLRK